MLTTLIDPHVLLQSQSHSESLHDENAAFEVQNSEKCHKNVSRIIAQ
jgi:hypothetical protein